MTRRGKPARKASKKLPPRDARIERRERIAQRKGKNADSRRESWLVAKRPVLRFALVFVVLIGAFNVYFYVWFSKGDTFDSYLNLNARACGAILRVFGESARVADVSISSPRFALSLKHGCDAIQASAFFAFMVLASPLRISVVTRVPAIVTGIVLLLGLNLLRIVTLYYAGAYVPCAFEIMHVEIWQALFIFLPLLLWMMWVRRALRADAVGGDV